MFVVLTADKGIELILDSFRSHMHPILHICLLKFWTKNLHLWGFSLIFGLLWYYYGHLRLIPFWLCTILHVLAFMNMREYVLQKRSLFEESFKLFLYIIVNLNSANLKRKTKIRFLKIYIKWGASSRWSSSLYFPKWNSDQMIIGITYLTLRLNRNYGSKWFFNHSNAMIEWMWKLDFLEIERK